MDKDTKLILAGLALTLLVFGLGLFIHFKT
jgi:hypothetical protein